MAETQFVNIQLTQSWGSFPLRTWELVDFITTAEESIVTVSVNYIKG
jgi:hypothetical protein